MCSLLFQSGNKKFAAEDGLKWFQSFILVNPIHETNIFMKLFNTKHVAIISYRHSAHATVDGLNY